MQPIDAADLERDVLTDNVRDVGSHRHRLGRKSDEGTPAGARRSLAGLNIVFSQTVAQRDPKVRRSAEAAKSRDLHHTFNGAPDLLGGLRRSFAATGCTSMTEQLQTSDETATNAFDFYNTYLSVIYGLLATQGLTSVVTFTSKGDEHWDLVSILLFGGTFVTTMHFWFELANIDDSTRKSYGIVSRVKHSRLGFLLMVDTIFATTFAGLLLAMFSAIPAQPLFFLLFVWLSGVSVLFNSVSGFLFYHFTKGIAEDDRHDVIRRYRAKVPKRVKQDIAVGIAATALYLLGLRLRNSVTLSVTYLLLTIAQLAVGFFPYWSTAARKWLGRLGAHA
jgi:hypothetical protein